MNHRPLHALLLPLFILLALLLPAPAHAQPTPPGFKPGTYVYNPNGFNMWSLTFTQDPAVPTRYIVSGTLGSIVTTPVTGIYDAGPNQLHATAMKASLGSPELPGVGTFDVNGEWRAATGTFHVQPVVAKEGYELTWEGGQSNPGAAKVAITGITLDPLIAGQVVRGRLTVNVQNLAGLPREIYIATCFINPTAGNYRSTTLRVAYDGDYTVDFDRLPITAPNGIGAASVQALADGWNCTPRPASFISPPLPIQQPTRAAYVDRYSGYLEEFNDAADYDLRYNYRIVLRPGFPPSAGEPLTETVTLISESDPSNTRQLRSEKLFLPTSPETPAERNAPGLKLGDLSAGDYRIVTRIEGDRVAPYTGVVRLRIHGVKQKDPIKTPDPAVITGSSTYSKNPVKSGESFLFDTTYSYNTGAESLDLDETVEVRNEIDNLIKTLKRTVHLKKGETQTHHYKGKGHDPHVYKVKVTVSGRNAKTWTNTTTFTVEKSDKPDTAAVGIGGGGMIAVPGTYGLVKKEIGKAGGPDGNQYGAWSGSQGESSFSATYESKPPYDSHFSCNVTWSAPPSILKIGDVVELTCSASATSSGKDAGASAVSAGWEVTGAVDVLENTMGFAGVSGSTGKLWPSGNGKCRFKVTTGSTITISSRHPGVSWGSGGNWTPCTYTYKRDSAPTVAAEPATPTPPEPPADPDPAGGDQPEKGFQFTPADPGEAEDTKQIVAFFDTTEFTLHAGEVSRIDDLHISNFRTNTLDRVEVVFPQKTDDWASLPGQIVVGGGNGSYDPANMGRPEHVDGYFFSARITAPGGTFPIDVIVRQKGAGFVRLTLMIKVVPRPPVVVVDPNPPQPPPPPPGDNPPPVVPPVGPGVANGNAGAPTANFEGEWNTTFGAVKLTQHGLTVEGTYPGGTITGTLAGDTLTFKMDEPVSPAKGYGRFIMDPGNNSFDGGWTYSDRFVPPVHTWHGTRGLARPDPNAPPNAPPVGGLDLTPGKVAGNGWTSEGVGAKTTLDGDKLVLDVPKSSEGETVSFAKTPITGDFDITVDYALVDWNANPEASLSWTMYVGPRPENDEKSMLAIAYVNDGGAVQLSISTPAQADQHVLALPDVRNGKLRLARTGSTWTVWYLGQGDWRQLGPVDLKLPPAVHVGFGLERQGAIGAKALIRPHATGTP